MHSLMNYSHILSFLFLSNIFCYELEIAILPVDVRRLLELTVLLFDSVNFAWKYYMYKKIGLFPVLISV